MNRSFFGKACTAAMATAAGLFLTCIVCVGAAPNAYAVSPLPWLTASGSTITSAGGSTVELRGVNLGGWLVEEPWMEPIVSAPPQGAPTGLALIQDHVSLWKTAKSRFGEAGMLQIRNAFRSNWITEADVARMRADGMTCVRLPFLASIVDEPGGLQWLDRAISWGAENHIYVILDMHGAPGSQSDQDHTGQAGLNRFFKDPSNIAEGAAIWRQIASRYKDDPTVAGYDLINEPTGTPNSDTLYVVQNRLYEAVRSVDTRHIIFIEDGYTGIQWMPFPSPAGWQNVAYSVHYYDFGAHSPLDQSSAFTGFVSGILTERNRRHIPYYVGEFAFEPNGTADTLASAISLMDRESIEWTSWTYKVTWNGGHESLWSLYSNTVPVAPLNMYTDSLSQLIAKCATYRTEHLTVNAGMQRAFQETAGH
jgi:hypothetical protein